MRTQKTVDKTVDKTVEKIIQLIRENPKITQEELAKETGLTRRGIEWNIKKLREEKILKRVGGKKASPCLRQFYAVFKLKKADITVRELTQKTPQKTPQKTITELEQKILKHITKRATISRREIALNLKISEDTVKEYLKRLKQKGILKRSGGRKHGHWEVTG